MLEKKLLVSLTDIMGTGNSDDLSKNKRQLL